jgi:xanthine dehydrogenase YagR molybdenum-binding subunit
MSDAAPIPAENQGSPAARIDARLKVTGGALYAADMPVNDALFGVLATSPISRGTVTAIHVDSARAVPGVVDVIT